MKETTPTRHEFHLVQIGSLLGKILWLEVNKNDDPRFLDMAKKVLDEAFKTIPTNVDKEVERIKNKPPEDREWFGDDKK